MLGNVSRTLNFSAVAQVQDKELNEKNSYD